MQEFSTVEYARKVEAARKQIELAEKFRHENPEIAAAWKALFDAKADGFFDRKDKGD